MAHIDECQQKMDDFLDSVGYWRKQIAADGSCLFRAVSEHVYRTQSNHEMVRLTCVHYIRENRGTYEPFIDGDFDKYLDTAKNPKTWGGHLEMHAMAVLYKKDFLIFDKVGKDPYLATENGHKKYITLCYVQGSHYDCVYPKHTLYAAAICQSIVYDVLYKDVFQLGSDVDTAVQKMLYDKTYFKHKKNMTFEQWKESVKFGTEVNAISEEEQVAKALDPTIYRNVEFDIWNEVEKERIRNEQMVIPELGPGVKCLVRLERDKGSATFQGHVQKMEPNCGLVTVFIEKLGEMCTVAYESVEALPLPARKAVTWRTCKMRSVLQKSILPDLQEVHKCNRRVHRKGGKGLSFLFPPPLDLSGVSASFKAAFCTEAKPCSPDSWEPVSGSPSSPPTPPQPICWQQWPAPLLTTTQAQSPESPAVLQDSGSLQGPGTPEQTLYLDSPEPSFFSPTGRISYYDPAMGPLLSYVVPSPKPLYINYNSNATNDISLGSQEEAPPSPPLLTPPPALGILPFESPVPGVDLAAHKSLDPSGSDLPRDVLTLRWFYNIGCDYFRWCTGQPFLVPPSGGFAAFFSDAFPLIEGTGGISPIPTDGSSPVGGNFSTMVTSQLAPQ
ncbi:protein ovarian tumor locus-like [Ornithodoros turicata]|uniref:protein ovarian tumor locus-like n=1 Tax=Ornithodoros turicata TaxID=34597 RepID=UPI0031387D0F